MTNQKMVYQEKNNKTFSFINRKKAKLRYSKRNKKAV